MSEPTIENEQVVETTQNVEQKVETPSTPTFDINAIQEMIKKTVEDTLKSNIAQASNNTSTIKPQTIKSESDVEAMFEKKLQQMEQKMFLNSLTQSDLDELKKVPEYESLKPSQIKAILGLKSLPKVETTTPKSEGGSLNDYINKARGK